MSPLLFYISLLLLECTKGHLYSFIKLCSDCTECILLFKFYCVRSIRTCRDNSLDFYLLDFINVSGHCVGLLVCIDHLCFPDLLNHMNWPDLDLDDIKDLGLDWADGEMLGGPPTPAPAPATVPAHSLPRTISPSTFINTNSYPVSDST